MSHRTKSNDTRQGISKTRDTTVPRTGRLQSSKQDGRQLDYVRPTASSTSRSKLLRVDTTAITDPMPRARVIPGQMTTTPSANLKHTESSRTFPSHSVGSKSSGNPPSTSQEVPLVMDTGRSLRTRTGEPISKPISRPSGRGPVPLPSYTGTDTIFGVPAPNSTLAPRPTELPPRLIPELQALASATSRQQDRYAKSSSSISSPSTQFSNTPSPWSISTTTTTPTSWSSTSPGIVQYAPPKLQSQRSQTVPVPATKRDRLPKLPALLEANPPAEPAQSSDSISQEKTLRKSSSTKRTPLNTPAPTPPPRTSSAKQALSRGSSRSDKQRQKSDSERNFSSSELDRSPLAKHGQPSVQNIGDSMQQNTLARAHNDLQQSLDGVPVRPSRQGVTGLEDSRPVVVNTHRSGFTSRHKELLDSGDEDPAHGLDTAFGAVSSTARHGPGSPEGTEIGQRSPSRLGKLSRLGLFGRRGKSPANDVEKSPLKLQRKGPVAGTGHEGYGKYSKRGRKQSQESSSANNSESERSLSSTRRVPISATGRRDSRGDTRSKRASQSDLDEFAATRLTPVPIRGGSGSGTGSPAGVYAKHYENEAPVPVIDHDRWGTLSHSQTSIASLKAREDPKNIPTTNTSDRTIPSLAIRRSQRFHSDADAFNLPTPIRTEALTAPIYLSSHDTSYSSARAASASTPSTIADTSRNDALQKNQSKKSRKLRWNIFRRREVDYDLPQTVRVPSSSPEEMSVSVSTVPVSRPMPYYAMMDSEPELITEPQTGQFLPFTVESPAVSPYLASEVEDGNDMQYAEYEESFLPSAPVAPLQSFARSPPPVPLQSPVEQIHVQIKEQPQRQPRLARVGRIPPVVTRSENTQAETTRSERQHRPSRASFSQPFARRPIPEHAQDLVQHLTLDSSGPHDPVIDISQTPSVPPQHNDILQQDQQGSENEFLQFPSRHASDFSSSSTSEGALSLFGPILASTLGDVRSIYSSKYSSNPYDLSNPSLDEVWNEYDDFIDHVMSPSQERRLTRALNRSPAVDVADDVRHARPNLKATKKRGTDSTTLETSVFDFPVPGMKRPVFAPTVATSTTPPVIFAPSTLPMKHVGEDIRLRRSRIVSALHSSIDPTSPFSIRELLREYETQPRDSGRYSERLSTSTAGQPEGVVTTANVSEEFIEHNHQENVTLLDVVERSKDPARQSELHYAFLMVAKWLSFGRVLFSPAHDEIQALAERHVLVIDGLGNEDWSIYCAVTYEPHKAFIHSLREKSTSKNARESKQSSNTPSNHRRADVTNFYERFPFPPSFFSVVVLRFPPAMAEAKMKNIISECRRVLLPGGYLELMLLDLDIVNMGVQTRRAVRELKFKMTTADSQISLRPIIDNVQGVLGARGFSNISRCVVGVPVAGRPGGSADSSSSSRSSAGSEGLGKSASGETRSATASPRMNFSQGRKGANLSLNDLIADHSDNADAKIGKIVSSTARRWWQHCFEAAVIADGNLNKSVFADKAILSECKARGSSFKMLIAYAQRPVFETRRRTMSEPVVPTLATIGSQRSIKPTSSGSAGGRRVS